MVRLILKHLQYPLDTLLLGSSRLIGGPGPHGTARTCGPYSPLHLVGGSRLSDRSPRLGLSTPQRGYEVLTEAQAYGGELKILVAALHQLEVDSIVA